MVFVFEWLVVFFGVFDFGVVIVVCVDLGLFEVCLRELVIWFFVVDDCIGGACWF